jgi:hypothetical protein
MTVQHTNASGFEELISRESNGILVALLWNRRSRNLKVTVHDACTDAAFEIQVGDAPPLDVFNHPFAYEAFDRTCRRSVRLASMEVVSA